MDQNSLSFYYILTGYRDYIAARFLLNNNFPIQGLTLASTAVEKYLKSVLVLSGKLINEINVHLDKIEKLKKLLSECYIDFTVHFDSNFLVILSNVYKMRYYDSIKEQITVGFFVNQVIGELDFVINFFETKVIFNIRDENNKLVKTPYFQAIEKNEIHLIFNNYLFNGISKKQHMEKPDSAYGLHFNPTKGSKGEATIQTLKPVSQKYDGTIYLVYLETK